MGGEALPLDSHLVNFWRKLNKVKKAGVSKGGWGLEPELPFPCKHELGQRTTQSAVSFALGASENRKTLAPAVRICSQCLEELWLEAVLRDPGSVAYAFAQCGEGGERGLRIPDGPEPTSSHILVMGLWPSYLTSLFLVL